MQRGLEQLPFCICNVAIKNVANVAIKCLQILTFQALWMLIFANVRHSEMLGVAMLGIGKL